MTIALAEKFLCGGQRGFPFQHRLPILPRTSGVIWSIPQRVTLSPAALINAAGGLYADQFNNMVSIHKLHITPVKANILMDKRQDFVLYHLPAYTFGQRYTGHPYRTKSLAGPTGRHHRGKRCTQPGRGLAQVVDKPTECGKIPSMLCHFFCRPSCLCEEEGILSWAKRRWRHITRRHRFLGLSKCSGRRDFPGGANPQKLNALRNRIYLNGRISPQCHEAYTGRNHSLLSPLIRL